MSTALALHPSAVRPSTATAICAHCGEQMAPAAASPFCCSGCAAAYRLVGELGLGRYYERRRLEAGTRLPRPPDEADADLAAYATVAADGTSSLQLLIDGLHCPACVWLIETALQRQPGVIEARVNLTTRRLHLRWRGGADDVARLAGMVQRLGYRVVPYDGPRVAAVAASEERSLLRALAVAAFAAGNVMLLSVAVWAGLTSDMGQATRDLLHWVSALIALPAIAYAGQPFFRSAWRALRQGRTNMDVPISLGVTLATAISLYETIDSGRHAYFDSAAMLLFFLLIGRYLDLRARGRARSAAEQLIALMAQPASVLGADGHVKRIPATAVAAGEMVLVAAGERVPVDGRVVEGRSALDKSLVDGESMPAQVGPQSAVLAGMLNLDAPLKIVVTATGERTFLAEIVRLMEMAEQGRARLVVLADRVARRYAPAVHLLALLTFAAWIFIAPWQQALLNAVTVLLITCPCALGLAVPVVQVIATRRLMRRGILLKSATALERLAAVDTVVFDKTGTLTLGRLDLVHEGDAEDLARAASLAAASRHPLSQALQRACPDAAPANGVREHPGAGLSLAVAEGELRLGSRAFCGVDGALEDGAPELWLARPGRPPRRFVFRDILRPDAEDVVAALQRRGMRVTLLSGDRPAATAEIAAALGIADYQGGLAPKMKHAAIAALAAQGRKVLAVGDGLNDAPALAAAFVSMSPATAADVCQTAADVVFQGASLGAVREVIAVAHQSGSVVRQNIAFAIAYNLFAVPLAMLGWVTPLLAALAMSSSSLIVVANALRVTRSST